MPDWVVVGSPLFATLAIVVWLLVDWALDDKGGDL